MDTSRIAEYLKQKLEDAYRMLMNAPDGDTSYRLGYYRALENTARDIIGSEQTDKIVEELSRKYG